MTLFSSLYGRRLSQELGSEDSTVLFTTSRRQAGVNDGLTEFADLTECFIHVSSVTWPGGTLELNLTILVDSVPPASTAATDFIRLAAGQSVEVEYTDASSRVTIVAGDGLRQVTVAWLNRYEPGWRTSTVASSVMQLPRYVYIRPDNGYIWLGLVPVPSTGSSASIKVRIPYVARPPLMTLDTDAPYTDGFGNRRHDLQTYHPALVHFAAHQLEKLRRDDVASDRQLQRFLSYVTRYMQAMRQRGGTALTYARNYWGGSVRSMGGSVRDPRT